MALCVAMACASLASSAALAHALWSSAALHGVVAGSGLRGGETVRHDVP
jgi:hypothetical protein